LIRARTHLFGSIDGYRTLARSPDICDADDAALAALGFGSPRTEVEFEALERELCVAGRPLPSGDYAITRVFAGAPDVAGRRTIERRTLLLDSETWAHLAHTDLWTALRNPRHWSREPFAAGRLVELRVDESDDFPPMPTEAERRTFDALLTALGTHRCAVFPAGEPWDASLLRLPNFLASSDVETLGWGVGLWSVPTGVMIATMHPNTGARNVFMAATSGPWQHPDRVSRLGHDLMPTTVEAAPVAPLRHRLSPARHLPLLAGVFAMLLASLMVWWAVRERDALDSRNGNVPTPRRDPETRSAQDTLARTEPAAVEVGAAPLAPSTVSDGAAPGAQAADAPSGAPAAPQTPSTTAPAVVPAAQERPFDAAPSKPVDDAFGSGTSAPTMDSNSTDMAPDPVPAVEAPAPVPVSSPSEKPNIPKIPVESAPWDAEVALARQSIDLRARAREATTAAQGVALIAPLAEQADALLRAHRHTEKAAGSAAPSEKCLILIDARNKKRGLTDMVKREQLSQAFSPLVVQRMMLLCARFEISLAVQDLARRNLIDTGALPRELRGDARADGWPDETPWVLWYFRSKDAPVSTAADGARYMASEFDQALNGHPGTRGAQQVLETLAKPAPSEASP
jgi:hypothetical protein